jgi:hypothetical protein
MKAEDKEIMFLNELEKYENKWVALVRSNDTETIVGSGEDALEAKKSAESNGYGDPVLYKVHSFNLGYIPMVKPDAD